MKKKGINRKGISPLIATILLIGFTVSIIILIIFWGKNYIQELAEKRGLLAEKQQECNNIKFTAVKACWWEVTNQEGTGKVTRAEIVLRNNADIPIHKFIFTAAGGTVESVEKYGKTCGVSSNEDCKLGSLETKTYGGKEKEDVEFATLSVKAVSVIPHLRVAIGHYIPCTQQKLTLKLTSNC